MKNVNLLFELRRMIMTYMHMQIDTVEELHADYKLKMRSRSRKRYI